MKNKILFWLGLLIIPFVYSCEKETVEPTAYEASWKDGASLKFNGTGPDSDNAFLYNVEVFPGGTEYWNLTSLDFDVTLLLDGFKPSAISKIDLYVFAEEKNGESFKYLGGNQGKLLTTINNPEEVNPVSISKDEIATMFASEFSADHNGDIKTDDIFEIKWVITGKDGSVLDSRTDCTGFNCSFGFGTKVIEVAPPIWEGTFNYEWTEATPEAIQYGKISVGQTGTITISLQPGSYTIYDVSHLGCGYNYGGPGVLEYGYETGEVKIVDPKNEQKWTISSIDGATLTINFSYKYSASYNEYCTFTLTRTDDQEWPTNLYGS